MIFARARLTGRSSGSVYGASISCGRPGQNTSSSVQFGQSEQKSCLASMLSPTLPSLLILRTQPTGLSGLGVAPQSVCTQSMPTFPPVIAPAAKFQPVADLDGVQRRRDRALVVAVAVGEHVVDRNISSRPGLEVITSANFLPIVPVPDVIRQSRLLEGIRLR